MITTFHVGGAIDLDHQDQYILRSADIEIGKEVSLMKYVLVIEPRQQGKTSLVNALMRTYDKETEFAYVDITTIDQSSIDKFYESLCKRINDQLEYKVGFPYTDINHFYWREYLRHLASNATSRDSNTVIILDEIGAIHLHESSQFFSILRDIFNSRQVEPILKHLTFVLVGAFHPRDLISDKRISPFNVARRIRLVDFSLAEVKELVAKGWSEKWQVEDLARRILYWTSGQPYLVQYICAHLPRAATQHDIDVAIEKLRKEDENHLPPILERLGADPELMEYLQRIRKNKKIRFYPSENIRQSQLELLGLIKADEKGFCKIRNRIYSLVLESFYKENYDYSSPDNNQPRKLSNRSVAIYVVLSAVFTLFVGLLSDLVANYIAPQLAEYSYVIYIALGVIFIVSVLLSIFWLRKKGGDSA